MRCKFYKTELLYVICCLSTILVVDSFVTYVSLMCQIFPTLLIVKLTICVKRDKICQTTTNGCQGQPPCCEFQGSQGYFVRTCLKIKMKRKHAKSRREKCVLTMTSCSVSTSIKEAAIEERTVLNCFCKVRGYKVRKPILL